MKVSEWGDKDGDDEPVVSCFFYWELDEFFFNVSSDVGQAVFECGE